jgi:hypothetical protein
MQLLPSRRLHAHLFILNLLEGLDDGVRVLKSLGLAAEVTGDGLPEY